MEIYQNYQIEIENIKKMKAEQNVFRQNIQSYEFKKNENEMVKKELEFIEEGDEVFKLVGPMLVKEEISDAKQNVAKRVDFITKEIEKFDKKIQSHEETIVKKTKIVQDIQAKLINAQRQLEQKQIGK